MKRPEPRWLCGLVALALPLCVPAAEQSHPCARVRDDAGRLACYDAVFGMPVPAARQPAAQNAAPAPAPPPVAAPAAPAAKPEPVAAAQVEKASKPDKEKPARGKVTAVVAGVNVTPRGVHTVTLDNGQVWRQLEPDSAVMIEAGDTISLQPGALGSYQLVTSSAVRTRVTQVK